MQPLEEHRVIHSMGIPIHLTLLTNPVAADKAAAVVQKEFNMWDARFSRFKESSELVQLNAQAGSWVSCSLEMLAVISRCLELAEQTEGAFDPSVGSYLASAGYGLPKKYAIPQPVPTYRDITLDIPQRRIRCAPQQILEPAAIVKGLAIDAAGRTLQDIESWMLNAGGDILTQGTYHGALWNVAIQDPFHRTKTMTAVSLQDCAIATSGDYQTVWQHATENWHHQVDMRSGKPTQTIASVTVVAPTAEEADTLASILFLLPERSVDYPHLPYCLVYKNKTIERSRAFQRLEEQFRSTQSG